MADLNRRGFFGAIFGVASTAATGALAQGLSAKTSDVDEDDYYDEPILVDMVGTVLWYDPKKSYGMIQPDAFVPEVLVYIVALRASGFQTVKAGARIHFQAIKHKPSRGFRTWQIYTIDGFPGVKEKLPKLSEPSMFARLAESMAKNNS